MAVTINNYNDLKKFVSDMIKNDISELDDIGRLQFDFLFSMPQKISAAKNNLRPSVKDDMSQESRQAKGMLRLIEETENILNSAYEKYSENAFDYYIATKGLSILEQAKGNGTVSVTKEALDKLRAECSVFKSRNTNHKKDIVIAYGVLGALIDGKSISENCINNYIKYGFLKEEQASPKQHANAVTAHFSMLNDIKNNLSAEQHTLMLGDKPLASNDWIDTLMDGTEPLKLAPEKAMLCLDKTEMSDEKLSINNYKKLMKENPAVANLWAEKCFDNMFKGMYNASELEAMEQGGVSPLEGVYIDGRPMTEMFPDARRDDLCRLTAEALLDGGHSLSVCRMEKDGDRFTRGTQIKTEVSTELPEKVSLWHRFLRWLGIEKTQKEKMSISDIQMEETIEKINSARLNDKLIEKKELSEASALNADRVFFQENSPEKTSFPALAAYSETPDAASSKHTVLMTMDRSYTRGHLAQLYMIGSGMSIENAMSTDPALDERKKELGREFLDTITILDRKKFAAEKGLDASAQDFEKVYIEYCTEKEKGIADMYNNVLLNGLKTAERTVAGLDINAPKQLAEKYDALYLCVMGGLDYEQSLANYLNANPEDTVTKDNHAYANAMKGYSVVLAYCDERAEALSPDGMAKPSAAVHALMYKAGAERVMNSLDGKTLAESSVSIQRMNEFKGMNDAVRLSGKIAIMEMGTEAVADMQQGSLSALKSKAAVPQLFADFIDNALNPEMRKLQNIPLPTTPEKFAAQFDKQSEIKEPTLTKSK